MTNDDRASGEELERRHDLRPEYRVPPHDLPFRRVETAGFAEDGFRNSDLADVVKQSRLGNDVRVTRRQPGDVGEAPRQHTHTLRMAARVRIFRFEGVGETEERLADRTLCALIEVAHVLGVAKSLFVGGIQPPVGSRQVAGGAGGYLRAHKTECGSSSSTSDRSRTGENGFVR